MKNTKLFIFTIAVFSVIYCLNGKTAYASETICKNINSSKLEIQSRADIIEWRYKTENNRLYRRLYNYSKQVWIGEWEIL